MILPIVREFEAVSSENFTDERFSYCGKIVYRTLGHKVKSLTNPDMRVVIIKDYVKQHFPKTPLLDYALEVCVDLCMDG